LAAGVESDFNAPVGGGLDIITPLFLEGGEWVGGGQIESRR